MTKVRLNEFKLEDERKQRRLWLFHLNSWLVQNVAWVKSQITK